MRSDEPMQSNTTCAPYTAHSTTHQQRRGTSSTSWQELVYVDARGEWRLAEPKWLSGPLLSPSRAPPETIRYSFLLVVCHCNHPCRIEFLFLALAQVRFR